VRCSVGRLQLLDCSDWGASSAPSRAGDRPARARSNTNSRNLRCGSNAVGRDLCDPATRFVVKVPRIGMSAIARQIAPCCWSCAGAVRARAGRCLAPMADRPNPMRTRRDNSLLPARMRIGHPNWCNEVEFCLVMVIAPARPLLPPAREGLASVSPLPVRREAIFVASSNCPPLDSVAPGSLFRCYRACSSWGTVAGDPVPWRQRGGT